MHKNAATLAKRAVFQIARAFPPRPPAIGLCFILRDSSIPSRLLTMISNVIKSDLGIWYRFWCQRGPRSRTNSTQVSPAIIAVIHDAQ